MDRLKSFNQSVLACCLALISAPAFATSGIGGGEYDELPPDGPIEPFLYVDGISGTSNIAVGSGSAVYFDAASNIVTVETPHGAWDLPLSEVINYQTVSSPHHALTELNHVFKSSGMSVGVMDKAAGNYSMYTGNCLSYNCRYQRRADRHQLLEHLE